jgi:hypothetical protein
MHENARQSVQGERRMRYRFYIHNRLRSWRLVTAEGALPPAGYVMDDWSHSRTREHDDTTPDVRQQIAEQGFALFKLGGGFADIARELEALESSAAAVQHAKAELMGSKASLLEEHPVHLGLDGRVVREPAFTSEFEWYRAYAARHAADGADGRLVCMFAFERSWDSWEVHPHGSEVVLCTAGELTLVQQIGGEPVHTTLTPGQYAINPPGVWHTADVARSATAVFITAGSGTDNRPR